MEKWGLGGVSKCATNLWLVIYVTVGIPLNLVQKCAQFRLTSGNNDVQVSRRTCI